jgi:hypothetical protein
MESGEHMRERLVKLTLLMKTVDALPTNRAAMASAFHEALMDIERDMDELEARQKEAKKNQPAKELALHLSQWGAERGMTHEVTARCASDALVLWALNPSSYQWK